jgi:hypothetical protein
MSFEPIPLDRGGYAGAVGAMALAAGDTSL